MLDGGGKERGVSVPLDQSPGVVGGEFKISGIYRID